MAQAAHGVGTILNFDPCATMKKCCNRSNLVMKGTCCNQIAYVINECNKSRYKKVLHPLLVSCCNCYDLLLQELFVAKHGMGHCCNVHSRGNISNCHARIYVAIGGISKAQECGNRLLRNYTN